MNEEAVVMMDKRSNKGNNPLNCAVEFGTSLIVESVLVFAENILSKEERKRLVND